MSAPSAAPTCRRDAHPADTRRCSTQLRAQSHRRASRGRAGAAGDRAARRGSHARVARRVPRAVRLRPRSRPGFHPRQPRSGAKSPKPCCRGPSRRSQFMHWRGSWRALEGFMANLPRAFGSLGHAGRAALGGNRLRVVRAPDRQRRGVFRDAGARSFGPPGHLRHRAAQRAGRRAVRIAQAHARDLSAGAIRVRNLLGAQAILPWALRGADILQSGRARGEAYFRLESEESLALLLEHLPGFRLADRNRLLAMLLDVWYGGAFDLKESNWSPEKGRPFVETDGRSLYFPAVMGNRDEAILAVLHAARRTCATARSTARRCKQMFAAATVEFPRVGPVSWAPLFVRYGDDALRFQLIFDLCEDLRVDFRVQRDVPNYLQRLAATARATGTRHPESAAVFRSRARNGRGRAARRARRSRGVDARFAPLLEPGATRRRRVSHRERDLRRGRRCRASPTWRRCTRRICRAAARTRRGSRIRRSRRTSSSRPRPAPSSENQPRGRRRGRKRSAAERRSRATSRTAASARKSRATARAAAPRRRPRPRAESERGAKGSSDKGMPYPEWDYREARYKRNWSWVQEKRLAESNMAETQPAHEPVFERAEAPEESDPVAEADAHGAEAAAARRRRHGSERGGELRRGESARAARRRPTSTSAARCASAKSR